MRFRGRQILMLSSHVGCYCAHSYQAAASFLIDTTGTEGRGFVLLFLLLLLERLQTMTNDGLLLTEHIVMGRKLCSEPLTNADLEVFLGTDHYATIYTSPHQLGPDCASRCGSVSGLEASFDKNHVAPATCCSYLRFTSAAVCDHCYCTCAATNC